MPVRLASLVLFVTVALASIAGCGAPCNPANVCAVVGSPPDTQVCDGRHYALCDDNNRGQVVSCVNKPQRAVCSPSGWAFEPAAPANENGGQP